jgi:transposase-like protein
MITKTTTHHCRKCNSTNLKKNGKTKAGAQKFACKDCGAFGTLVLEGTYSEEEREAAILMYYERASLRGVERVLGPHPNTLTRWLKKSSENY